MYSKNGSMVHLRYLADRLSTCNQDIMKLCYEDRHVLAAIVYQEILRREAARAKEGTEEETLQPAKRVKKKISMLDFKE